MLYTTTLIASMLYVSNETVRQWIVKGKLKGYMPPKRRKWLVMEHDFNEFCKAHPEYIRHVAPKPEKEEPVPMKNSEGYSDPTAYFALRNIDNKDSDYRFHRLLNAIQSIVDLADFRLGERIVLVDKKTGKIYK